MRYLARPPPVMMDWEAIEGLSVTEWSETVAL
jgi:hypothetical protein